MNNIKVAKELIEIAKSLIADNHSEIKRLYNDFINGYQENEYDSNLPKSYQFKNYTGEIKLDSFFMKVENATFEISYNKRYGLYIDWKDGTWIDGTWEDGYWFHGYDKLGNEHGEFDYPGKWDK